MAATMERFVEVESPIDVSRITGIRIHGDEGVSPVDRTTTRIAVTGPQRWLVWTHGGLERAVNYRHIVEFVCDEFELTKSRT